ncbi:MAG: hypothetical protein B6I17_00055 [Tenericutes bacterium 4572_104]|nr:MAG: hypothetical protein B6I17_00055 [Tenericutes bacterium 4572_104]
MTLTFILKVLITALLGYFTLNTFLKFHFSINRFLMMFFLLSFFLMVYYLDTEKTVEFIIAISIIAFTLTVIYFVYSKKKNYGYFFFNVYRKQYSYIHKKILNLAKENEVDEKNICHDVCKPYLVVFRNTDRKKAKKIVDKLDEIETSKKIKFTMYSYWVIVIFLVLMAVLWRF